MRYNFVADRNYCKDLRNRQYIKEKKTIFTIYRQNRYE